MYFAFGLVGSVAVLFGAFPELKDGIEGSYYILNVIKGFVEISLVALL